MSDAFGKILRGLQKLFQLDEDELAVKEMYPDSEAISEAVYDPDNKTLYIRFTSGSNYQYANVSGQRWNAFKRSASKGQYFVYNIRENYIYSRGI